MGRRCRRTAGLPAGEADYAADVAATVALDGAVSVAQDCIQVLGGIGFTFEHDAHLYLRRAIALRVDRGCDDRGVRSIRRSAWPDAPPRGQRREHEIDFDGADVEFRETTRREMNAIAELPADEQRAALAQAGYLIPHLPRPARTRRRCRWSSWWSTRSWPVPSSSDPTSPSAPGQCRRSSSTAQKRNVNDSSCRRCSVTSSGASSSASRGPAPIWRHSAPAPYRTEGGWKLTGQKVWTSRAHDAEWGICLARTDRDAAPHRGITYFLIDMTSAGIDVRPLREMTGDALFNEVFLDEVFVPDECVVGEVNDGWKLARTTLANERVAMAGSKLGLSTERAVELLAGREAELEDGTDAARVGHQVALATLCHLLGLRSTLRSIAGQGPGAESSVAKLLGVRSRQQGSELVVDLLGPEALYAADDPKIADDVHEMLLTRCLSIAGGTTQILRNVAAERVLGLPRG